MSLEQRLAEALRDAAVHLAFDEHRVHQRAEVVDDAVFRDADMAGVGVDLDLGDVAAVGERRPGLFGSVAGAGVERLRVARGEFFEADGAVRAARAEQPVGEVDVLAEVGGGERLALVDDRGRRVDERAAAPDHRARAAGAAPDLEPRGVALDDPHAFDLDAEAFGEHLRVGGLVALAVRLRADRRLDRAVLKEAHVGEFVGGAAAGDLDVESHAAAVAEALGFGGGAARGKAVPVGLGERGAEERREVADVEGQAEAVFVRQLVGAKQVPRADLIDAEPKLARGRLHQALDEIRRLGPTGAAIGVDGGGVGHDAVDDVVHRGDAVDTAHDAAAGEGLDRRAELRLIGAEVGPGFDLEAEDHAAVVERKACVGHHRAAVRVGLEGVGALAGPFDGPAEVLRGVEDEAVFGVDEAFHAETAADIAGDDAKLIACALHDVLRHVRVHAIDALTADGERIAGAIRPFADGGAHLHRDGRHLVLDDAEARDVRRGGERRIGRRGVADLPVEDAVRRRLVPDLGRALGDRGFDVVDDGEVIVVDLDGFGGVACLPPRFGDDEGDAVADEAHGIVGEQPARRLDVARQRHEAGDFAVIGERRPQV